MKAVLLLLLALLAGNADAFAQHAEKDRELLGANSEGTRFVVGFMENELYECTYSYGERAISIASRFNTTVTITYPDGRAITDVLKPMQLRNYQVERQYECIGEGVFKKGIEITSTSPVSVYCYSSRPETSDGYLALPVDSWGTQYLTANYKVDSYTYDGRGDSLCTVYPRGGEFAIIAAFDSTRVTVYPKTRTYQVTTGSVSKILMKGEIYQLQDGGFVRGWSDLTGSVVTSDKPVGLLTGHVRTGIPVVFDTKDHIIEMVPPRNTLGKRYVAVPFGGRLGGDLLRVILTDPGETTLQITTPEGSSTQKFEGLGAFAEFIITQTTVIEADKPVMVMQYSRSMGTDPRNNPKATVFFDPDLVTVTPEEQFVNAAVFQTLPNVSNSPSYPWATQFEHHYVTIVAEEKKFGTITLNGEPLINQQNFSTGPVPGTPFVWATMEVRDGRIHVLSGDALFGGYVYGVGYVDSYAWPIGAGLRKFDVTDEQPPVLAAQQDCGGFNVTASESGPFESGLRDAWIDSSYSQNVEFQKTMIIIGDEFSLGYVSLKDSRTDGRARFIAEDLSGNRDTIEINLSTVERLSFDRDSVAMAGVKINEQQATTLVINNANANPLKIDSLWFKYNRFYLNGRHEGAVIAPGALRNVNVLFMATDNRPVYDTLVIKSNCQYYRIPFTATVGSPGIITHDLDFGRVRVGSAPRTLALQVSNPGTATLRFDSTVIQVEGTTFSLSSLLVAPDSLLPGEDTTLQVMFIPPAVGELTGRVLFYSNADSVATASLRGVGIYPNVDIGGYDFGLLPVGDTACTRIPVTNTGSDTLHLTDVEFTEEGGYIVDRSVLPADLAPGDTVWVPVCFAPLEEAGYLSDIFPMNNDGVEGENKVRGAGYVLRATLGGYDWKERWVNTTHDTVVLLRNLSTQPITIDSVYIDATGDPGDFTINETLQLPVAIGVGEALPIKVSFTPLLPGLRSCIIRGIGGVPGGPRVAVDSVLQGFGLLALASDEIEFDNSLIYSCGERSGSITIVNDGNTPLTLSSIQVDASPALLKLRDPDLVSRIIPVGESLQVDFTVALGGYVGPVSGAISWSFQELPDTLRRSFAMASAPQFYGITASAPATLAMGKTIELQVAVDSAFWSDIPQREVELRIEHNPRISRFDFATWAARSGAVAGPWRPVGAPVEDTLGVVLVRFASADAAGTPLDSAIFPQLPFLSYLGNTVADTFDVRMRLPGNECFSANLAYAAYRLDSICGLDNRLFEMTGDNYSLKQNHPNPTGSATEIEFTLGMDAHTRLELFASDGRTVRVLVDSPLAAGHHMVAVDLSELPSGLYFYRLNSGPFMAVRQMMVAQ